MAYHDENTGATLVAPPGELNFLHSGSTWVPSGLTAFSAYLQITEKQPWLIRHSFAVRDWICRLAGVREIGGFLSPRPGTPPETGQKLDFFDVIGIGSEHLVLAAPDRHLNVYICLHMGPVEKDRKRLHITASVKTLNLFGNFYMLPVAPAHRMIVRHMLDRFKTA